MIAAATVEVPRYFELEIVLDSGAGAHVAGKAHCPGYEIKESEYMRQGATFLAADGGEIENLGATILNIVTANAR